MKVSNLFGYFFPLQFFIKLKINIFSIIFLYNNVNSQGFPSIILSILDEQTNLLDVEDNENNNFIITTKHLFHGFNPENNITFSKELPNNKVFANFDSIYLQLAQIILY